LALLKIKRCVLDNLQHFTTRAGGKNSKIFLTHIKQNEASKIYKSKTPNIMDLLHFRINRAKNCKYSIKLKQPVKYLSFTWAYAYT
jgi:hypothetical protein